MNRSVGKCFARAGLLGNPSDGFGGKTISLTLPQWWATSTVFESPDVRLRTGTEHRVWPTLDAMFDHVLLSGHSDPCQLLTATLVRFLDFCGLEPQRLSGLSIEAKSTIPVQVGLAGSSAIIIATLRALCSHFQKTIRPELMASLALQVETDDLRIPAGLQDRVVQSMEGLIAMDFSASAMQVEQGLRLGRYRRLDVGLLPPTLFVAWSRRGAESTAVLHNNLRQRFDAGETVVVDAMIRFAGLADDGIVALETGDQARMADLINANFDLRQSICQLNPLHVEMIETARRAGASAKYCGSGGAIIGTVPQATDLPQLKQALESIDCEVVSAVSAY
jgi:glucuronokinase